MTLIRTLDSQFSWIFDIFEKVAMETESEFNLAEKKMALPNAEEMVKLLGTGKEALKASHVVTAAKLY